MFSKQTLQEPTVPSPSQPSRLTDSLYGKRPNSLTVVGRLTAGGDALGLFPKKLHEEP